MNTHALMPLIATIAYIPLFVILLLNWSWDRRQKLFLLFMIPAMLWSFSDIFFRSDFFMENKLTIARVSICFGIWMTIQLIYLLSSFSRPKATKMPFVYILLVAAVALLAMGYMPKSIEVTSTGIIVNYGIWFPLIGLLIAALGFREIYLLVHRYRVLADPVERNQISYLFGSIIILMASFLATLTPLGSEYPIGHIGNLGMACILTYAVAVHHLADIRVALRHVVEKVCSYAAGIALTAMPATARPLKRWGAPSY